MNTKHRTVLKWIYSIIVRIFVSPDQAKSHKIAGYQTRFVVARPGAGSVQRHMMDSSLA